ncbi:uncharacterized protein LOC764152 [Strongylocentrotus purpuratus]|uniref:Proline-rich transmembrane protein 3/4 domain-containing protein n=1 Tax=Strongylocentrotus purpuratus TaxID=7668 RepID=A0A7M7PBH9_STRPU|nr:uncharacterized protein LOC764152 [Strongylocentrotus purpuratus]XP_030847971.1 uncharacterized protein LOC764152 [Strongylocentrotus purpuratus]XP_030847972.1 uncharacterized protein LOC764152 [Strongylocentrotus purpuratus]
MTSTSNLENETTMATMTVMPGDHGVVLSCSWAESGPNRTKAQDVLSHGLNVHIYLFASCYALMLIYAIYAIIRPFRQRQTSKRLGVALHTMIAMTSLTRSLSLFTDPYGLRGIIPCPFNVIIWSFGWPGVVSSNSIFFLAVLETTNLTSVSRRFQRFSVLLTIIALSLGYVLFTDLLVSFLPNSILAVVVCEIMFIVWGISLTVGFVYVWWKIRKNLAASCPRNARERRRSSLNGSLVAALKSEARRLNRLVNILIISALVCLTLTLSHLEPVFYVLHCSILDFIENPWQWIFYQTGQRVFEISMCVLIMVAMLNSSHNHKKKTSDKEKIVNKIALESGMENKGTNSRLELPRTDMQLSFDEKEYDYSHNDGREGIL